MIADVFPDDFPGPRDDARWNAIFAARAAEPQVFIVPAIPINLDHWFFHAYLSGTDMTDTTHLYSPDR